MSAEIDANGGPGSVPDQIFKAYDVRGLYGDGPGQMNGSTAYLLGRAFARVLAELRDKPVADLRIGVGRDMRLQAPEMAGRLSAGLVDAGAHVLDAGMVGTEMLYFMVGARELDGGAMVTASHNPKAYTGVKLVREGALALSGETGINAIRDQILAGLGEAPGGGSTEDVDIAGEFRERALSFIDVDDLRPLKVVVDGGNGMAGEMVGPLLDGFPIELVSTYWAPDGNFPDHEPNPLLPENRAFIIERVRSEDADVGIAWDGDADRCFFIDDRGEFVDGDFLTALLAELVLEKSPGADILYDVRASRAVPDTVAAAGGVAHINRVGHAFMKRAMKEIGGEFAGEVSGHYYFRAFYNADSGTIPALLVLELISKSGRKLSDLVGDLRAKYFISGEINSEVADPEAKMNEIAARHPDAEISWLDGVSVDYRGLAFQRPALQHRAAPAPQPGVAGLAGGHGGEAGPGARFDPLLSGQPVPGSDPTGDERRPKRRMLIIVNPYATTVSDRLKNLVVYALQGRYEVEAVATESQNHATEIGREAVDGGYDIVVAFGGDGTLNEVVNGLAGTDIPVSVLPGGSTNVVARSLGIPNDVVDATEHLLSCADDFRPRPIDLGIANGRRFVFACGAGLDATAAHQVDAHPRMKHRLGPYYYTWAAVKGFYGSYLRNPVQMKITSSKGDTQGVTAICQNTDPFTYFRGREIRVSKQVRIDDGTLALAVLHRARQRDVPFIARRVLGKRSSAGDHRRIDVFDGITEARIESSSRDENGAWRRFPVQLDGDPVGLHGELDLAVDPGALRFVS